MKLVLAALSIIFSFNALASVDKAGITLSHGTDNFLSGWYPDSYFLDVGVRRPGFTDGGWWFNFNPTNLSLTFVDTYLDPGVELYSVPKSPIGLEFSAQTIPTGVFTEVTGMGSSGFHITSYSIPRNQIGGCKCFYLGVNTGFLSYPAPNVFTKDGWDRSVFGWAKFSYSSTGLQLVDSALTYDSAGIYIGTNNTIPVPEPETYAMLLAGLGLTAIVLRRRRQS